MSAPGGAAIWHWRHDVPFDALPERRALLAGRRRLDFTLFDRVGRRWDGRDYRVAPAAR